MSAVKDAAQTLMKKALALAPDSWMPGGIPDPLIRHQHGLIGAPVSRIDGPQKVQGAAQFAAEVPLDDMVYAALVYSGIVRGRIATLDVDAAGKAPGVVLVMTYRNAPRIKPTPVFMSAAKAAGSDDIAVMQDDEIHWNGQPIALVLAATQEQAGHAASLIQATYEPLPGTTSVEAAKVKGIKPGNFGGQPLQTRIGDADAALAAAPFKIDATYTTPRHNHNAIELHATTLRWDGDDLFIHDASQMVSHQAWTLAQAFGLDESQIHISSPFVGGGFGGKGLWNHQILAAAAAKIAQRPVRIMLSREGVYRVVGGRTLTEQRVAIGAQADGRFDALIHSGVVVMGEHNNMPEPFILATRGAYAAGSIKLDVEVATMDMLANTFMRAPGESVGTFALECAVDELAHAMGIDPVELRARNEPDKDPTTGLPFSSRNIVEAYRAGAGRFGGGKRSARAGPVGARAWMVGMGVATRTK
uniref:xanthine dehydrogenase family protein molybdopterin-binding subunit n=1 Tax=Sphingomonas sp. TaxID=28214 RepID=UPI003B3A92BA